MFTTCVRKLMSDSKRSIYILFTWTSVPFHYVWAPYFSETADIHPARVARQAQHMVGMVHTRHRRASTSTNKHFKSRTLKYSACKASYSKVKSVEWEDARGHFSSIRAVIRQALVLVVLSSAGRLDGTYSALQSEMVN